MRLLLNIWTIYVFIYVSKIYKHQLIDKFLVIYDYGKALRQLEMEGNISYLIKDFTKKT